MAKYVVVHFGTKRAMKKHGISEYVVLEPAGSDRYLAEGVAEAAEAGMALFRALGVEGGDARRASQTVATVVKFRDTYDVILLSKRPLSAAAVKDFVRARTQERSR